MHTGSVIENNTTTKPDNLSPYREDEPTIVVFVRGGAVELVETNRPLDVRVLVCDFDAQEARGNEDGLFTVTHPDGMQESADIQSYHLDLPHTDVLAQAVADAYDRDIHTLPVVLPPPLPEGQTEERDMIRDLADSLEEEHDLLHLLRADRSEHPEDCAYCALIERANKLLETEAQPE